MTLAKAGIQAYLSSCPLRDHILVVLWVRLHFNLLAAAWSAHGEVPYLCGEIAANLLLLGIEAHTLSNQMPAAIAPDVEGHLEADDQDALVQLLGALAQRMLALELQAPVNPSQA